MEAIFDFLKNIFSFRDITLSSLAVLSVVLILLILLTYKTLNKNAIYLILAVIMGVLIYMVIRGENNRKPIIDEINQKPPRLTLIVHEASSHTNRFIESRGKIILYSEDENKKASYNIGKSGIINIDSMLPWTANDSSGIQILINSLDSTKENALVIGNRYFIKANDTVMVGYTYLTINKNKSVVPDEPINVKSNEIGIYFNKKNERKLLWANPNKSVLTLKSTIENKYFSPQELNSFLSTTLAKDNGNSIINDETNTLVNANIQHGDDLWLVGQPKAIVISKRIQSSSDTSQQLPKIIFTGINFRKPVLKIGNEVTILKKKTIGVYEAIYVPTNNLTTISISDGSQTFIKPKIKLTPNGIKIDVNSMKKIVAQDKKYIDGLKNDKFDYKIFRGIHN